LQTAADRTAAAANKRRKEDWKKHVIANLIDLAGFSPGFSTLTAFRTGILDLENGNEFKVGITSYLFLF